MKNFVALVLLLSVVFFGCKKEKFRTDSNWLTPVVKSSLSLSNLLPDSNLVSNSDNSTNFVIEEEYTITSLDDVLVVPDRVETIEVTLSSLVLEDREFSDTLTLGEMYPASLLFDGQTTVLPAQDINTDNGTVIDVTEEFFTTATFNEGYIDIEIHNDLPVEAEVIEFELLNNDDKSVILSGVIANLPPFGSDTQTYSLAGKTVNGVLEMNVSRIKTKASAGAVLIEADKGLRTTFRVRDLKPQVATAVFPAQNLVNREDETLYSFGGAELTRIIVKEGDILMKVESSIEEAIILDYSVPNSSKQGAPGYIQKEWTIPAAAPGEKVIVEERFPIDEFDILLKGEDPYDYPLFNHIYNVLIARIEYSGIERTLSLDDKIKIEFGLVDIVPFLVTGDPGFHQYDVVDTVDLNFFKNLNGDISLEDATFELSLENSFGIEALLDVNSITGSNNRNPTHVNLISPEIANPILLEKAVNGTTFMPDTVSVLLDKTNSNIKQFLENLPDQIKPNFQATIRPNGTINQSDFAFDHSSLVAKFKLDIPISFGVDSLKLTRKEPVDLFSNEDVEDIKSVKILVTAENGFPISGELELEFLDASENSIANLFTEGENIMLAAEVDPTSGKVDTPMESELRATIDAGLMLALRDAKYVRIKTMFNTKDASRYKMYDDYKIDLKLITEITYESKL
jgi:hypothetical protein